MQKASRSQRMTFRDRYLAVVGVAVFLLSSFVSNGQVLQRNTQFGVTYARLDPDSTLYQPTGCGAPTDASFLFSSGFGNAEKRRKAARYYDSCGHHDYIWDPSLQAWHIADSSSGSGSGGLSGGNQGSGFRVYLPPAQGVRTLFPSPRLIMDSTSNANGITVDINPDSIPTGTVNDARYLAKSANLGDLANAGTSRTNLGLGTAATHNVPASGNANSTEVVLGNDTRLTGGSGGSDSGIVAGPGILIDRNTATYRKVYADTFAIASRGRLQKTLDSTASLPNFPAEQTYGTISDVQNWQDYPGYFKLDNPLNGNTNTATLAISALGVPTIGSTGATWFNVIKFMPDRPILAKPFWDTVQCTMTQPITGNSTGGGLVFQGLIGTTLISYKFYLNTSTSNNGNIHGATETGTTIGSDATGTTIHQNDQLQMALTLTNDTTLVFSYRNITTGSAWFSKTITFTTPTGSPNTFPTNTGCFGFLTFSQVSGATQFTIQRNRVGYTATRYAANAFFGTSKTAGLGCTFFSKNFVWTLRNLGTIVNCGDGGGTLPYLLARREEALALNPMHIFIEHCNDTRSGFGGTLASTEANLLSIDEMWQNRPYYFIIPEDSLAGGTGLAALHKFDSIAFGPRYIWQIWNTLTGGTNRIQAQYINADGIHPNDLGNHVVDSIIRVLNLIQGPVARKAPYSNYAHYLTPLKDYLAFNFRLRRSANRYWRSDDSSNVTPGSISEDNAGHVSITAQGGPTPIPGTSARLQIDGLLKVYGTLPGLIIKLPTSNDSVMWLASNLAQYFGFNGIPLMYLNKSGQLEVGSKNQWSTFQISDDRTFDISNATKGKLTQEDSATYTANSGQSPAWWYGNKYEAPRIAAASGYNPTVATNGYWEEPYAGTNAAIGRSYAGTFNGKAYFMNNINVKSLPDGTTSDYVVLWNNTDSLFKKIPVASIGGGGNPFADNTAILKNNADNTKLLKFDLSGITTANTRTMTVPDYSGTLAVLDHTQTFSQKQTYSVGNRFNGLSNPSNLAYKIAVVDSTTGDMYWIAPSTTINVYDLGSGTSQQRVNAAGDTLYIRTVKVNGSLPDTLSDGTINILSGTSGTYTPTVTALTNASSPTASGCTWTKTGNIVTVDGSFDYTNSTTGKSTLTVSLPSGGTITTGTVFSGMGTTQESSSPSQSLGPATIVDNNTTSALVTVYSTSSPFTIRVIFHFAYNIQ